MVYYKKQIKKTKNVKKQHNIRNKKNNKTKKHGGNPPKKRKRENTYLTMEEKLALPSYATQLKPHESEFLKEQEMIANLKMRDNISKGKYLEPYDAELDPMAIRVNQRLPAEKPDNIKKLQSNFQFDMDTEEGMPFFGGKKKSKKVMKSKKSRKTIKKKK